MKFRKKPIEIEAFQMTRERWETNVDWPQWLHKAWNKEFGEVGALSRKNFIDDDTNGLRILTLEGYHSVSWDDWIIQGIKGELYPCKPDIFEATYDPVA